MRGRWIKYSDSELTFIKTHCALSRRELTERFNQEFDRDLTVDNIKALCTRMGWKTGRDGRFKPGNVPHPNSGLSGPNKTSFKKGNVPANVLPLYSERINKDGYIEIKIPEPNPYTSAKTRFKHKHVWLWEQAHGPIPKGHAVVFKDGDRMNCVLANLECVHRRVLQQMNKKFRPSEYPKELRPSILAVSKVTAAMAQRAKETGSNAA